MALKGGELSALADFLRQTIAKERLSKTVQYGDDVFFCSLSRSGRLVFSLNNQDPLLYLASSSKEGTSLSSGFSALLRKRISGAEIIDVQLVNRDRIVDFTLRGLNEIFKEEITHLIVELIPTKANLILTDENRVILGALRTNYITDPHPVFRGIRYEPPERKSLEIEEGVPFDPKAYFETCLIKEEEMARRRQRNRFQHVYRVIATKRKSAKRKIAMIEQDIEKAKRHLNDGDYGTFIYTNMGEIDPSSGQMDYYGKAVPLDPRKTSAQNAEAFFKAAKKAKTAIALGEKNLAKAIAESEAYESLAKNLSLCDEAELERLGKEYGLNENKAGEIETPLKGSGILPYRLEIDGLVVLFGTNSRENDFLSFLYKTDKDFVWFHPKDRKGAHLIACHNDPNPRQMQLCCEIALAASNLQEGEVMFTEHKNIRRGSVPGLAIVKTYQSVMIRAVSKEAKELKESAQKIKA